MNNRNIQIRDTQFENIFRNANINIRNHPDVKKFFNGIFFFLAVNRRIEIKVELSHRNISINAVSLFLIESLHTLVNGGVFSSLFALRAAEDSFIKFLGELNNIQFESRDFSGRRKQLENSLENFDLMPLHQNYAEISKIFHQSNSEDVPEVYLSTLMEITLTDENLAILVNGINEINLFIVNQYSTLMQDWDITPIEELLKLTFSNTKTTKLIRQIKGL